MRVSILVVLQSLLLGASLWGQCPESITDDRDGKVYPVTRIEGKCWMAKNLDVGKMLKGDEHQSDNGVLEKYCYGDKPSNCARYGGLYEWDEMMQYTRTEDSVGICPEGWRLPRERDWQILDIAIGKRGANSLKEKGTGRKEGTGTNETGFSALLSGFRHLNTVQELFQFWYLEEQGAFWSSSELFNHDAVYYYIKDDHPHLQRSAVTKSEALSVRCLQD